MARAPKKAAGKTPKAQTDKKTTPNRVASQPEPKGSNLMSMDEENRKLFLNVHLPEIKKLREKLNTANANLRNGYKTAKAEGGFTKADFDYAVQVEDEEKEAKAKARIARQLVIARYMGKGLGRQLELFLEEDRTPAGDIAFEEGKQDAIQNKPAKPEYHPATEQHRRYMEGYHSVSEERVKGGIKPLHPEVAADKEATDAVKQANEAQRQKDAKAFEGGKEPEKEEITSGVPTSRAQFLAQQQLEKEQSAFSKKN